jgi:hypothetical protein
MQICCGSAESADATWGIHSMAAQGSLQYAHMVLHFQAKELEERRLKRAAIQAKLAAEQAERCLSQPVEKKPDDSAACVADAEIKPANNGAAALLSDAPDADAKMSQLESPRLPSATCGACEGDDAAVIDSDAEGQQAEDLFREMSQHSMVRSILVCIT